MINNEQEQFARNHIPTAFFDSDKIISYLKLHDKVGSEIFDLALKQNIKRNIRLVTEGVGYTVINTDIFVKRIPFYFYVPDFDKKQRGDLLSFFCEFQNYELPENIETVYTALEKLTYTYKLSVPDIMSYPIKITGYHGRNDIFFNWVDYLNLCHKFNINNYFPDNFLFEYNKLLELDGKHPIIYEPGLIGFNENFIRCNNEIIISGEFPCDRNNIPALKWIGVWIENASYVKTTDCYSTGNSKTLEKQLHIGITPYTKIYMPNIYNKNDGHDIWYPIYFGPRVMELNNNVFKHYRKKLTATQQNLADAVGVDLRTYQKWEKGDCIPEGYNLIRLMNYLNIETVQEFIVNEPIIDDNFEKFRNRTSYNT